VIKTFADKQTQALFATGRSTRLPPEIVRRARRKLESIDLAASLDDLRVPLGKPAPQARRKSRRTARHRH
jgi:proteic killer suppression protein